MNGLTAIAAAASGFDGLMANAGAAPTSFGSVAQRLLACEGTGEGLTDMSALLFAQQRNRGADDDRGRDA